MASAESSDELAECPECGGTAMSSETPCSRCQDPTEDDGEYDSDRCQNCGSHVSETFRRVLGDNENIAHACQDCTPHSDHFHGAVAGTDTDAIQVTQR